MKNNEFSLNDMNTVTFETAKALRDAGFPQPEPAEGQFWWFVRYPDGAAKKEVLCVYVKKEYCWPYIEPLDGGNTEGRGLLFAPTATDILSALMDYEKLSLATEGISEFLEIIILPEELAKKWMEFNSKPA